MRLSQRQSEYFVGSCYLSIYLRLARSRVTGHPPVDSNLSTEVCKFTAGGAALTEVSGIPRPIWKGAVSFGLVTIPVGL